MKADFFDDKGDISLDLWHRTVQNYLLHKTVDLLSAGYFRTYHLLIGFSPCKIG